MGEAVNARSKLLVFALAGVASAGACKSKEPDGQPELQPDEQPELQPDEQPEAETQPRSRALEFDEAGAPVGARVWYGEHELGLVREPSGSATEPGPRYVDATLPPGFAGSEAFAGFSIELRTPCGLVRVPLTPVTKEGRDDPLLHFEANEASGMATTRVWTDVPGATIVFGELEATPVDDHYVIERLDCGVFHDVVVNGEPAGTLEALGEGLEGVWVAKDADTCYEVRTAAIREAWTKTTEEVLSGARVYNFPYDHIDHRFEPMPEELEASEANADTTVVGINVVDCAAADR